MKVCAVASQHKGIQVVTIVVPWQGEKVFLRKGIPPNFRRYLQSGQQHNLSLPALTRRSLVLGLGLVLLVSLGAPYSIWMVGASEITWSYFPIGVGAPFVLLIACNAMLKRFASGRALARGELLTILIMGLVASGMPIFIAGYVLSIISKPYYGATRENEWATFIQPHLPEWAVPGNVGKAMDYFYEGLPLGETRIPYEAWSGPLFWWLLLILAVYFICFCTVVLLRRHWVEHERLAFPLIQVPLLLVEESLDASLPPILRAKTFWIGCAVPLSILLFNCIQYFYPAFVQIPVHSGGGDIVLVQGAPPVGAFIYFPIVGFVYLVSTSISFSLVFFYVLVLLETSLINLTGFTASNPDPFVFNWQGGLGFQSYGAFVAMVAWSLWMGRRPLREVLRKVFGGAREVDDSNEMLSYRMAFWGFLGGFCFVLYWLCRSGMDLQIALLFLAGALIIFLGITRLVIQTGLHYLTTPMSAQSMTLAITGTSVAPHNLVALSLSYGWCGDVQSIFMTASAHAARLSEHFQHQRRLAAVIFFAALISFFATVYLMLHLCYHYGASNLTGGLFHPGGGGGSMAFEPAVRTIREQWPTDWGKLSFFALGALLYSLVFVFYYRFFWWPLHPVGLTLATVWMTRRIILSVLLAWVLKRLILRFGGVALYRRLLPLFIGLPVGFFIGVGLSYAIDLIWFFGHGHPVLHG